MAGRPSTFTDAIADEICERLSSGESLRRICLTPDMPNKATVFRWLASNKDFRDQYAGAREAQADVLADEIIDIADGKRAVYEGTNADVNRDRLSVDARKWVAAKLKPKVYGDKTLIGSDPDNPLPANTAPLLDASMLSTGTLKEVLEAHEAAKANAANPS